MSYPVPSQVILQISLELKEADNSFQHFPALISFDRSFLEFIISCCYKSGIK